MLTGVTRHRTSWRGKLILQVEYEFPHQGHFRWRDATERDVFELKKIRNSQTKGGPISLRVDITQRQESSGDINVYREVV